MKHKLVILMTAVLGACVTPPQRHIFGPDVDPVWAREVHSICATRHKENVSAYNRCLDDFAEQD